MIAFKVVTPKGEYLKQDVKSIHAKTVIGETTILPFSVCCIFHER